jgi:hypothetical protein
MPHEILEARYIEQEPPNHCRKIVRVANVERLGLKLNKSFACHACGVQLRYVPERNRQRAYFGRVQDPHRDEPDGRPCRYLLLDELHRAVTSGREVMPTLFLRAGVRPPAMRLDAVQELLAHEGEWEVRPALGRRPIGPRASVAPRALGSARAVVRLMVAMRAAGIGEAGELMDLDWRGQRVPWRNFFYSQEALERLWESLFSGRIAHPVAFVVRPCRAVERGAFGDYSVVGRRVGDTTPYLNTKAEGLLLHVDAGVDVLAFGNPTARGNRRARYLRLNVGRRAQVDDVPFDHDEHRSAVARR